MRVATRKILDPETNEEKESEGIYLPFLTFPAFALAQVPSMSPPFIGS